MIRVNMHCHTRNSDGVKTVDELLSIAQNIDVLALTDHNFVYSNKEILDYQKKYPNIELISGCELSTMYITKSNKKVQVHVVCLGVNPEDEVFMDMIKNNHKDNRSQYINAIKEKLWNCCNIEIPDYEEMKRIYKKKHISRMEINDYLVRQGFASDIEAAFDKYTGTYGKRKAYVNELDYEEYVSLDDALRIIKNSGAKSVLAHLYSYNLSESECEELVRVFKENGGDGMEVFYLNGYTREQIEKLMKYSEKYHLYISTGDDYHGRDQFKPLVGGVVDDEMYRKHIISLL